MKLFSELKRRNVLRMAVLYVVAAWLVMQVSEVVITLAELPGWAGRVILTLLAIGFPIALILSWFYELTSEGISLEKDVDLSQSITRVTGRRMDFIVIALLAAAVILFAYDKWWVPGPAEKSIAVLAFENMSDDPDQAYFADGISEELLNLLARVPELRVTSRSSAFSFKGKDVSVPEIAKQLNVAHVLEGSVRRFGNRARITAQLIDASSDSHLWSESYDRDLDDVFTVQDEIAAAISNALKVRLVHRSGEEALPPVIKSASSAAYDAYLLGRELIHQRDAQGAYLHLDRAVRLDDAFAPAHAQLAIAMMLGGEGPREPVIHHLDRAQALDPDLAEAHAGRALLAAFDDDPASSIVHARKALASNPSYLDAMNFLQIALHSLGQYEESDAILKRMMTIDPLSVVARGNYVERLNRTGRLDETHEMADRVMTQNPAHGYAIHARTSLFFEGNLDEGLAWGLKAGREVGNYVYVWSALIMAGQFDEARRLLVEFSLWVDAREGRWDDAIQITQNNLQREPDNETYVLDAADVLYNAGRVDEALPLYERLLVSDPEGRLPFGAPSRGPIFEDIPVIRIMRVAYGRRMEGDEAGAQAAAELARRGHQLLLDAGRRNNNRDFAEAMIAAFDGNLEGAIAALRSAVQHGVRAPSALDDPIFEDIRGEPQFVALRNDLEAIVAKESDEVLQLICFNNPVPDDWQPLPETCEGVVEQQ